MALLFPGRQKAARGCPIRFFMTPTFYAQEQDKLFRGPIWNYVALEAEVAQPGDFKATFIGDTPVVVTRDKAGGLNAFVNRCAHRGAMVCRELSGNRPTHTCIYHQWSYDLKGNLTGVPFKKGIAGVGGYGEDFDRAEHSLQKLRVAAYRGLIFALVSARTLNRLRTISARPCGNGWTVFSIAPSGFWVIPASG